MPHDDEFVLNRECLRVHKGLDEWINKIELRMNSFDTKLWGAIVLLVSNLVGIVILLIK